MSRQRMHKPDRVTDSRFVECSPTSRLLFTYMECFMDDYGVCQYNPKTLKMQIFPGDDFTAAQISGWISELIANGLLAEFEVDNKRYLKSLDWDLKDSPFSQKVEKPSAIRYPKFNEESITTHESVGEESPTSRVPIEEKLSEVKLNKKTKAKKDLVYLPRFLKLWEPWPKKIEKPDAAKMFELMIGDNAELLETAIGAVLRQRQERNDRKNLGLLVPEWRSLERWLKARKWEDEVMSEAQLREQLSQPKPQGFNQISASTDHTAEARRLANEKAQRDSDEVQKRDEEIAAKKREDQYQRWQSTYPDLSGILERKFSSGGGRANWIVACQQRDDQQQNMAKTA